MSVGPDNIEHMFDDLTDLDPRGLLARAGETYDAIAEVLNLGGKRPSDLRIVFDQDERGNSERRAIFVGLWAPTLWLIGDSLDSAEPTGKLMPLRRRSR